MSCLSGKPLPSQRLLNRLLRYDRKSGYLYWKPRPRWMFASIRAFSTFRTKHAGKRAFTCVAKTITPSHEGIILGQKWKAHRVIWKMVYGFDPLIIDHLNGNSCDNRLKNLRNVGALGNARNRRRRKDNKSGHTSIHYDKKRKRWVFGASINGRSYCRRRKTLKEAISIRNEIWAQHGFHPNHGRAA